MQEFLPMMARCPLFMNIAPDDLSGMLACLQAKPRQYTRGQVILAEGDRAEYLGIVLEGTVQVSREDYSGNRSLMARLGPGDLFAEAFACAGVERMPVSVAAVENARVLLIRAQRLMQPCASACSFHHQMIFNLMKILAMKNLACNQKIEVVSKRTTREKLLAYLMMEAKRAGQASFTIPYARQELADYLEVDRSGLSAEISKLRKEGLLLCDKNAFTLLSPPALHPDGRCV